MKRAILTIVVVAGALCMATTVAAQPGDGEAPALCDPTFPECGGDEAPPICYSDADCPGGYCEYYTDCGAEPCAPGETCDPVPCAAEGYCVYDGRCYSDADCSGDQACVFTTAGDRAPAPCVCPDEDPNCGCGGSGIVDPGPGYGYCENTGPIYCGSDIDCPAGTRCGGGASTGSGSSGAPCAPGTNCTQNEFVATTCEPSVVPCVTDEDCSGDWTCEVPQQTSTGSGSGGRAAPGPTADPAPTQSYCTPPGEEVKCAGTICEVIGSGGGDDDDRRDNDDCTTAPGSASTSSILLAAFALGLFLVRRIR